MTASPHATSAAPFAIPVRVYWEDTDAGGVVFYANYLRYFERARTEWLRAAGVQQRALREASGVQFVVTHAAVNWRRPALLDDLLTISVEPLAAQRASLKLAQVAWRGDERLADADVTLACVRAADLKPCRIPPAVWDALPLRRFASSDNPIA